MIYYIADMHFGHKNILKYDKRPFADTEQMDEKIIRRWNGRVNEYDTVYVLAEATTTELTKTQNPYGLQENREVAQSGRKIAGDARKNIEAQTGKPVITSDNAARLNEVVTEMIEGVVSSEDNIE